MDSLKSSSGHLKTKVAQTMSKIMTNSKSKAREDRNKCFWRFDQQNEDSLAKSKKLAAMEAFVAQLFACVSSIKAAYAELQAAQFPYNSDAIHCADEAVVSEMKAISDLKRSYSKKQLDLLSPHVTLLLAKFQEQQSLMRTYQITFRKWEAEIKLKDSKINLLKKELNACQITNKSIQNTLNSSGCFSVRFEDLGPNHFIQLLHYTSRSVRSFVKLMIGEMESAKWDLVKAANAIEPGVIFAKPSHQCFAFESFVWRNMIIGFNEHDFSLGSHQAHHDFFQEFKKLRPVNPKRFLCTNPNSCFAKFVRSKYLSLVHPKMECSLFGNLNQRELLTDGKFPDSAFFTAFAEMAKRVWVLHCLGFSFNDGVRAFEVGKNCRFSEVYMECVTEELFGSPDNNFPVGFTVVPGFKIGKSVIQCQVYLCPEDC